MLLNRVFLSWPSSIQEFHSMVEKEIVLAVHCLTVTWPDIIYVSGRKISFLKRLNKNNWLCCCVKVIFQASDFVQYTTCLWVILVPYTGCFCPVTGDPTHLFIIFILETRWALIFLLNLDSFEYLAHGWKLMPFSDKLGVAVILKQSWPNFKLEHFPRCLVKTNRNRKVIEQFSWSCVVSVTKALFN